MVFENISAKHQPCHARCCQRSEDGQPVTVQNAETQGQQKVYAVNQEQNAARLWGCGDTSCNKARRNNPVIAQPAKMLASMYADWRETWANWSRSLPMHDQYYGWREPSGWWKYFSSKPIVADSHAWFDRCIADLDCRPQRNPVYLSPGCLVRFSQGLSPPAVELLACAGRRSSGGLETDPKRAQAASLLARPKLSHAGGGTFEPIENSR
jgi:hypothetical protein